MAGIDWSGFNDKMYEITQSKKYKEVSKNKLIDNDFFENAGMYLRECIILAMERRGFEADRLVDGIYVGDPIFVHGSNHVYVGVYVFGKHKDSLYPEGYPEGYPDIAELLDRGYSAGHIVYKINDDGTKTYGLQTRVGLNYFSQAVSDFMGNYAADFDVVNVKIETHNTDF